MTTLQVYEKPQLIRKEKGTGTTYGLPSTIGYDNHDPSRYRSPAFTLRSRHGQDNLKSGPGPIYDCYQLTNKGPIKSPAFSISGRPKFTVLDCGPGPGAYHPEKCPPMNHSIRQPEYSILSRHRDSHLSCDSPGPNAYNVPPCLGPKVPHKKASSAFTIAGRWSGKTENSTGPGPGDYGNPDFYVVKKRHPEFTIKLRRKYLDTPSSPGPAYNPQYIPKKNSPMYSFGIRHSECAINAVMPDDNY